MKLSEFIRTRRERKCFTQKNLAEQAGVDVSTITRIETEKHSPGQNNLRKILAALGVSIEEYQAATQDYEIGEPPTIQPSATATKKIRPFVQRLNEHFEGHARILGLPVEPPVLERRGEYIPTPKEAAIAAEIRPTLKVNDLHALLDGDPEWESSPLTLPFLTTDFAVIQAKRKLEERPRVISASAVIVSNNRRILFVHDRSKQSATYPGLLHTFGGAFQPEQYGKGEVSLKRTMLREVAEESDLWLSELAWPVVISEETTTGFIQCVFLGVTHDDTKRVDNWEGSSQRIHFDSLPDRLMEAKPWVGSGKLHILAWLAAGCPGCPAANFYGQGAVPLLEDVLAKSLRDYPPPKIQA